MPFQLPSLPFARDALQPVMSAETLDFHYGKHHKAYVDKVNAMLADKPEDMRLVEVVRSAAEGEDSGLFNNAAQIWNHTFFWNCLTPQASEPTGRLKQLIDDGFGDTDGLLQKLEEEAVNHFSNGWAWLVLDRDQLKITSLHDADTPLVHDGMKPLFTIDVWEHAYYIDYRNERPKFVSAVLKNIINWDFVAENMDGKGETRADQEPVSARVTESA